MCVWGVGDIYLYAVARDGDWDMMFLLPTYVDDIIWAVGFYHLLLFLVRSCLDSVLACVRAFLIPIYLGALRHI